MVCANLEDLWELYLLDVLSVEESRTAAEHLATGCPRCTGQLHDAALTVYFLLQTGSTSRPSPKMKSSLARRLSRR
jgi:hypothetical protein